MKRAEIIKYIMAALITEVRQAYIERSIYPRKYKYRNDCISQALGLLTSLQILQAYKFEVFIEMAEAIYDYDIYRLTHLERVSKIMPYNKAWTKTQREKVDDTMQKLKLNALYGVKGGTDNDNT